MPASGVEPFVMWWWGRRGCVVIFRFFAIPCGPHSFKAAFNVRNFVTLDKWFLAIRLNKEYSLTKIFSPTQI
jgi:hypothetical protein